MRKTASVAAQLSGQAHQWRSKSATPQNQVASRAQYKGHAFQAQAFSFVRLSETFQASPYKASAEGFAPVLLRFKQQHESFIRFPQYACAAYTRWYRVVSDPEAVRIIHKSPGGSGRNFWFRIRVWKKHLKAKKLESECEIPLSGSPTWASERHGQAGG